MSEIVRTAAEPVRVDTPERKPIVHDSYDPDVDRIVDQYRDLTPDQISKMRDRLLPDRSAEPTRQRRRNERADRKDGNRRDRASIDEGSWPVNPDVPLKPPGARFAERARNTELVNGETADDPESSDETYAAFLAGRFAATSLSDRLTAEQREFMRHPWADVVGTDQLDSSDPVEQDRTVDLDDLTGILDSLGDADADVIDRLPFTRQDRRDRRAVDTARHRAHRDGINETDDPQAARHLAAQEQFDHRTGYRRQRASETAYDAWWATKLRGRYGLDDATAGRVVRRFFGGVKAADRQRIDTEALR